MIGNQTTCEDIVQNVFLKLYENLNTIKNKSSINFWLFKSARNEIYTIYRQKNIRVDQYNVSSTEDLEINSKQNLVEEFERKEIKELINIELSYLAIEQREVFILKEFGGLSYKEISTIMDIDENLVKSRLFNIRKKIIKNVSRILEEGN